MKTKIANTSEDIVAGYKDALGNWHKTSARTRLAILKAMDADGSAPENSEPVRIIRPRETFSLSKPAKIVLENGETLRAENFLPRDLPTGYHDLISDDGEKTRLIVSPGECHLPENLRRWGWSVQLYALRSRKSWGMGDLADLRNFARWSARELKCDFLLLNPLGAASPVLPQEASPYFPGSRRFWNPLYLRIEEIPGAKELKLPLEKNAAQGCRLNSERLIDRDKIFRLKMSALEKIWKRFRPNPAFENFRAEQGRALEEFGIFCALAERHNSGWQKWPAEFQNPDSPAVKKFAAENFDKARFHQWLQWLLDLQLARAAKELPLMQDLPVGFDPAGADAWAWQNILAKNATVGAPPDEYNTRGQNWGLPPFVPQKLRAAGYEPFRQTIRAALRHGGGLRIDHVMGLFRLFWIPKNFSPPDGTYVRYRAEELLAIIALESQRAKAVIVGEDLGTVEAGVRAKLRQRKMLSYRLLWFETKSPKKFPRRALAAVTTHDLFTIAGLWSGSDLAAQKKLGLHPNETGTRKILRKLQKAIRLKNKAPLTEVILRTHQLLAKSPSMLLTATLDDALAIEERPNMPGTTKQWPNWSIALPDILESIQKKVLVKQISQALVKK
jgi:4-alpha-glucanotransferase